MTFNINGDIFTVADIQTPLTLTGLLQRYNPQSPYAVAINGEFVSQSDYPKIMVNSQDLIDVVSPIFGG
ncbi:sulfur carrier protein ThiS [Neptunicella sp. SCSIO 80796]|uniref:sulfur carrier protein ThiS n=1 Tax=Neptunicella plasticusilytica TaxID=3117012 RepID=UPI003A4D8A44